MREIKFRAWDMVYRRMFIPDQIDFELGEELPDSKKENIHVWRKPFKEELSNWASSGRYIHGKDVILMQYTGLKDKNGKEIYEGDIVRHRPGTNEEIGVIQFGEYEQDGSGGEYSPTRCMGFYVQRHKIIPDDWEVEIGETPYAREEYEQCTPVSGDIEVIGDIYENPELLRKEE